MVVGGVYVEYRVSVDYFRVRCVLTLFIKI